MYQCRECNRKTDSAAYVYDEYDNDIYKRCGYCGGKLEKAAARCDLCRTHLYSGEKAYEVSSSLYCESCVTAVTV